MSPSKTLSTTVVIVNLAVISIALTSPLPDIDLTRPRVRDPQYTGFPVSTRTFAGESSKGCSESQTFTNIKVELNNLKTGIYRKLDTIKEELLNSFNGEEPDLAWSVVQSPTRSSTSSPLSYFTEVAPPPSSSLKSPGFSMSNDINQPLGYDTAALRIFPGAVTDRQMETGISNQQMIRLGHTVQKQCNYSKGKEFSNGEICMTKKGRLEFKNGNLIIRDVNGRAVWSVVTNDASHRLMFQNDGNLVLYSGGAKAKWASHTYTGHTMVFQEDRDLRIYDGNRTPLWSSITSV